MYVNWLTETEAEVSEDFTLEEMELSDCKYVPSVVEIVVLESPERITASEYLRYTLKVIVREDVDWSCRSSATALTSRAREPYRVDPELTTLDT